MRKMKVRILTKVKIKDFSIKNIKVVDQENILGEEE